VQGHMRTPFFSLVRVRIGGCRHILPSMGLCGMCKCNHMHMSPDSLPCSCAVAGGVLCVNEDIGALHQRDQACSEIAEIMQGFLPYPAPACVNLLCSHACAASFPNISADNRYAVLQLNEVRTYWKSHCNLEKERTKDCGLTLILGLTHLCSKVLMLPWTSLYLPYFV